jgi:hypothetical protein
VCNIEKNLELRDYQVRIAEEATRIALYAGFVYLAMEVRTGKTITSLSIADRLAGHSDVNNILFVTKKRAISSIESDWMKMPTEHELNLHCINYESLHKAPSIKWDVVILDEAHCLGAFPKPSKRAKATKKLIADNSPFVILLSGTPTPESYSQMYHQVYGIPGNPFASFKNFYRFADEYVMVRQKRIGGRFINDYSRGLDSILEAMDRFTISYTQSQAGFEAVIDENVLSVRMNPITYSIADRLKKDLVITGKEEVILADTAVKLMMKLHQIYSGTVKFESGNSKVLDTSKAEFIKRHFNGKKIGIFYKFKAELDAIQLVFGDDNITDTVEEFDTTDKNIALQIVSGREGISLKNAEALVYYNIDFSATSYWQSRDRMTTKERLHNKVYWVFSEGGIESDIYKTVRNKRDYTLSHFKDTFLSLEGARTADTG